MNRISILPTILQSKIFLRSGIRLCNGSEFNLEVVPLNKAINASSKAHNWEASFKLLDDALEAGCPVNVVSFGAALAACDRGSFWQHALRLFGRLAVPNNITWNAVISACGRAKRWEHACGLLEQMTESQFQPDIITFNSTMRSLGGAGSSTSRWQLGLALHGQLLTKQLLPSPTTYSTLTKLCAQGNAWHVALLVLQDATAGPADGGNIDAASFTSVLIACARSRRWQRSVQLFSDLTSEKGHGLRPDLACFNAAMSACERGGHWSGALHFMHQMRSDCSIQPDLTSLNTLLSACEKGCKWQEALSIFCVELPQVASETKPFAHNFVVTYGAIFSALTRAAVWPTALTILDDMQKQQLQPGPLHFGSVLAAMSPGYGGPKFTKDVEASVNKHAVTRVLRMLNLSVLDALRRRQNMNNMNVEDAPHDRRQEITKYAVAGMEILLRQVNSEDVTETLKLFRTVVYQPVVACLSLLTSSKNQKEANSVLCNHRLEEQFGLGSYFTGEALRDLGLAHADVAWQRRAEAAALQALHRRLAWRSSTKLRPVDQLIPNSMSFGDCSFLPKQKALAKQLVVWLVYDLMIPVQGSNRLARRFHMTGRPGFACENQSLPTEEVPLSSIFVEHDRGSHAERWALLSVIADLLAEGLRPIDFQSITGTVQLYAVHTPCISCLAAFCQFRSAFPKVLLKVAFQDWSVSRVTMHKVHESSLQK